MLSPDGEFFVEIAAIAPPRMLPTTVVATTAPALRVMSVFEKAIGYGPLSFDPEPSTSTTKLPKAAPAMAPNKKPLPHDPSFSF